MLEKNDVKNIIKLCFYAFYHKLFHRKCKWKGMASSVVANIELQCKTLKNTIDLNNL